MTEAEKVTTNSEYKYIFIFTSYQNIYKKLVYRVPVEYSILKRIYHKTLKKFFKINLSYTNKNYKVNFVLISVRWQQLITIINL